MSGRPIAIAHVVSFLALSLPISENRLAAQTLYERTHGFADGSVRATTALQLSDGSAVVAAHGLGNGALYRRDPEGNLDWVRVFDGCVLSEEDVIDIFTKPVALRATADETEILLLSQHEIEFDPIGNNDMPDSETAFRPSLTQVNAVTGEVFAHTCLRFSDVAHSAGVDMIIRADGTIEVVGTNTLDFNTFQQEPFLVRVNTGGFIESARSIRPGANATFDSLQVGGVDYRPLTDEVLIVGIASTAPFTQNSLFEVTLTGDDTAGSLIDFGEASNTETEGFELVALPNGDTIVAGRQTDNGFIIGSFIARVDFTDLTTIVWSRELDDEVVFNTMRLDTPQNPPAVIFGGSGANGRAVVGRLLANGVVDWVRDLPIDLTGQEYGSGFVDTANGEVAVVRSTTNGEPLRQSLLMRLGSDGSGVGGAESCSASVAQLSSSTISMDRRPAPFVIEGSLVPGIVGTLWEPRAGIDREACALFVRGDANSDGEINVTDASFICTWLFNGGQPPTCRDAADTNDSNSFDATDCVYLTNWLFFGGPPPPPPTPSTSGTYPVSDCGIDLTSDDDIRCDSFSPCI